MASEVNVGEAQSQLSELLKRVEAGEEIVISREGTPVARLVPVQAEKRERVLGTHRGEIVMHDDFDETPEEFLEYVK